MEYSKQERIQIANTIISQMNTNQNKLRAMLGAKDFVLLDAGLAFKFKMNPNMNYVKIELNGKDLYDITFKKVGTKHTKDVKVINDVYCDELIEIFESTTGLYLHL
jgi:hypothetical protein